MADSIKGKQFVGSDLPTATLRVLSQNPAQLAARLAAETGRWRVVAYGPKGEPYVAEELQERILRTLSPNARVLATMMTHYTPEERLEIVSAFDRVGELVNPFTPA